MENSIPALSASLEEWKQNSSKCYWIKKQIEPFHIHHLHYLYNPLCFKLSYPAVLCSFHFSCLLIFHAGSKLLDVCTNRQKLSSSKITISFSQINLFHFTKLPIIPKKVLKLYASIIKKIDNLDQCITNGVFFHKWSFFSNSHSYVHLVDICRHQIILPSLNKQCISSAAIIGSCLKWIKQNYFPETNSHSSIVWNLIVPYICCFFLSVTLLWNNSTIAMKVLSCFFFNN